MWTRSSDVVATFGANNVDRVPAAPHDVYVFDIHGGAYRLLAGIVFVRVSSNGRVLQGSVFLKEFWTHAQYDAWTP